MHPEVQELASVAEQENGLMGRLQELADLCERERTDNRGRVSDDLTLSSPHLIGTSLNYHFNLPLAVVVVATSINFARQLGGLRRV